MTRHRAHDRVSEHYGVDEQTWLFEIPRDGALDLLICALGPGGMADFAMEVSRISLLWEPGEGGIQNPGNVLDDDFATVQGEARDITECARSFDVTERLVYAADGEWFVDGHRLLANRITARSTLARGVYGLNVFRNNVGAHFRAQ